MAVNESFSESTSDSSLSLAGVAVFSETVCTALTIEASKAPSSAESFILRDNRRLVNEDSARKPEIPLCPLLEARSEGVLDNGNSGDGSVNKPGAAPRDRRTATVFSLKVARIQAKPRN